jgi:hypothetical protein
MLKEGSRLRMFENRLLRRIFGIRRKKVAGGQRLHNKEHHNLHSSNIIRVMKSRKMR